MQQERNFFGGGMDSDSAIEYIDKSDYLSAWNIRNTGTKQQELGYLTSIEGTVVIPFALPAGINKCIGSKSFPDRRKSYSAIYNSNLRHTITEYNYDTNTIVKVFQNFTDSGNLDVLNLNPDKYVEDWDFIGDELYFLPSNRVPSKIHVERFKSGFYGVIRAEDISVIQAKPTKLVTYSYISDTGRSANLVENRIIKVASQYQYNNEQESVFSELSKTFLPTTGQSSSASSGVNNAILVRVFVGEDRVDKIVVAAKFENEEVWKEIKSINRKEAIALPNAAIDLLSDVREAYSGGYYSFVFYNDGLYVPIDTLTTDLEYDRVPKTAQAQVGLNGSIIAYGNLTEGFNPTPIDITVSASYTNKLEQQVPNAPDYLEITKDVLDRTGNGLSGRPLISVYFKGVVKTGDVIDIQTKHKANETIQRYNYTVPSNFNNDTAGALNNFGATQGFTLGYHLYTVVAGVHRFQFTALEAHRVLSRSVTIFNSSNVNFKSISSLKLNSSRQYAIMYEYPYGRLGGVLTNDKMSVKTEPYSVTRGASPIVKIDIRNTPPLGAVAYHILSSGQTTHQNTVYMIGTLIIPTLYASGTYQRGVFVIFNGDVYRSITNNNITPPSDILTWNNIGSLGDYSNDSYLAFDVTSLKKFNDKNESSVVTYEYTKGDRANLAFYVDSVPTDVYYNTNPRDVAVSGFEFDLVNNEKEDAATGFILKINKSNINVADITGRDVMIEVYTPKKSTEKNNLFFSIGERYDIIGREHSVREINISSGESFIKTREYTRPTNPNVSRTYVVEDFNYSDFADTRVDDLGRGYFYDNKFKEETNKAWIRYSDVFNQANNINLLNRFKTENVYGIANGQTTDLYGGVMKMRQRGTSLLTLQELEVGYIPVNVTIYEDVTGQSNVAVSDKLLNNIRYNGSGIGIGKATKSFAEHDGDYYWVDPNKSEPFKADQGGIRSIAGKMQKFFRDTLQEINNSKRSLIGFYNSFYDEYILTAESESGVVIQVPFDAGSWLGDAYPIPNVGAITITQPTNGTVVQTSGYLHNYTVNAAGSFPFQITFGAVTRNVCVTVIGSDTTPQQFTFIDLTNQLLNSLIESNSILVVAITAPTVISIVGGQYEVNGDGVWKTIAGTVNEFDSVKVRHTSSSTSSTSVNTTLTIGGISDTFTTTTAVAVPMTIAWSNTPDGSPYTDVGFFVTRNGTEVFRADFLASGTISGFFAGDSVQVFQFHYLNWRNPFDATNTLLVTDGATIFNGTVAASSTTLTDSQATGVFVLNSTKTYSIASSSNSNDATLSTHTFTIKNSGGYLADNLLVELVDTTNSNVMFNVLNAAVTTIKNYSFNVVTDGNPITVRLTSNSGSVSVTTKGLASNTTDTRVVTAGTPQIITGITKGSISVETNAILPPVACGTNNTYNGGQAYPTVIPVTLGSGTGTVTLNYNAFGIPDKFIFVFDGVNVIDTGYRGDANQQTALNSALATYGAAPETIVGLGQGTASFVKTTTTTIGYLYVYAPVTGTAWEATVGCPI